MGILEEEADESIYWMELLADSGIVTSSNAAQIMSEADEILAMTRFIDQNGERKK